MELSNVLSSGVVMGSVSSTSGQATSSTEGATFQNQLVQIVNNQATTAGSTETAIAAGALTQLVGSLPILADETLSTEELDQLVENLLDQLETLKDEELTGEQLSLLDSLMQQLTALVQVITLQNEQPTISFDVEVDEALIATTNNSQHATVTKLQDQLLLLQQSLHEGSMKIIQGKQPEVIITNQLQHLQSSLDDLVKELKVKQSDSNLVNTSPFVEVSKENSAASHLQRLSQEMAFTSASLTNQTEVVTQTEADDLQSQPTTALAMLKADNAKDFLPLLAKTSATTTSAFVLANEFADTMEGLIVQKFNISSLNGLTEARLMLTPENLGHVDVKISMQNGILTAIFQAETAMGKDAIENQMVQLRASLASQGITVDKIEVTQTAFAAELSQQQKQGSQQHLQDQNGKNNNNVDENFEEQLLTNASHKELGYGRAVNEMV
ncbi:MAG: flagellar hook-length control protein FliK [Candidatus Pristimantibacillus lignocellulolyticus]|uniref:Flagellar hook-length control protein FliK n=1 Tax=Candidatus Pristimantibacillus lignocellulolyticus TaxID=2994561 RepID=A0A9J6ZBD5_9BACL|nr:MAG: flagellar hook-length control protein FliK [Candidatus Pristimantibacillus lignocellulolyticus]